MRDRQFGGRVREVVAPNVDGGWCLGPPLFLFLEGRLYYQARACNGDSALHQWYQGWYGGA
jgi:hypothetical protein